MDLPIDSMVDLSIAKCIDVDVPSWMGSLENNWIYGAGFMGEIEVFNQRVE